MARRKISMARVSILLTILLGIILGLLVLIGIVSSTLAAIVIGVMVLGMLVVFGGGTELASGLSDTKYEQHLQSKEEERKQWEADYYGYTHEDELEGNAPYQPEYSPENEEE